MRSARSSSASFPAPKRMRELSRRPALLLAVALVVGLVVLEHPILVLLVLTVLWLAEGLGSKFAVLGSFLLGVLIAPQTAPRVAEDRPFLGEAIVDTIPVPSDEGQSCQVESNGERFLLYAPNSPLLARGDVLELNGVLRPLSRFAQEAK